MVRAFVPAPEVGLESEHPYSLITLTLAYTGMRWGELAAVRRKRIKILERTLHIAESLAEVNGKLFFDTPKTHRDRTLVLPAFLVDLLSEHLKEVDTDIDALVFTTKTGTTLRVSNWHSRVWRPAVERSEIPQGAQPHDLRHFCASVLIRSGASPVLVARQLDHSSPKVTLDIYSHLFPADLGDMAVRLDGIRREAIATHARHAETKPVTPLPHETSETVA